MRRIAMGIVLLLHGLAHANAGMLAADRQRVFATTLWAIASVCFMAVGVGLLGVRQLGRHWQALALTASASSLLMLGVYQPVTALPGLIVDLAIVGVVTAGVVRSREFYSYDWLERLVGDDIRNADHIHPEWQALKPGDLVRATQPDYLGGVFGSSLGWRVTRLEPERVLVLGGWGAFILEPVSDSMTRLIVRTRGAGKPNVALAPVGLLVFEPAHFIMQRRMLLGIRDRAEGRTSMPGRASQPRTSATAGRSRAS